MRLLVSIRTEVDICYARLCRPGKGKSGRDGKQHKRNNEWSRKTAGLSLRATCINDTANMTNGTAEYNKARASKWPFNYANTWRDVRPAIIKLFNSCQTRAAP